MGCQRKNEKQKSSPLTSQECRRPFDLTRGPLMRTRLIQVSEEKHILLLGFHSIICDERSISILFRELGALYNICAAGRPSPLPELPIQYADFAVWQQNRLRGDILKNHLDYWKRNLQGCRFSLESALATPGRPANSHAMPANRL